ncbi:hypothetical protein M3Y94_00086000 [Aphelenchoides besseyi]|nr:hypothetical protein M3Y94_00086000 [Aphelenchoides besseyi]KAI6237734.1 hypothetical protein M3Y95_00296200 [Aphelenchoides besseyi]
MKRIGLVVFVLLFGFISADDEKISHADVDEHNELPKSILGATHDHCYVTYYWVIDKVPKNYTFLFIAATKTTGKLVHEKRNFEFNGSHPEVMKNAACCLTLGPSPNAPDVDKTMCVDSNDKLVQVHGINDYFTRLSTVAKPNDQIFLYERKPKRSHTYSLVKNPKTNDYNGLLCRSIFDPNDQRYDSSMEPVNEQILIFDLVVDTLLLVVDKKGFTYSDETCAATNKRLTVPPHTFNGTVPF